MLEDFAVAIEMLRKVTFKFVASDDVLHPLNFVGNRSSLTVELNLNPQFLANLPVELQNGALIKVYPVLLTQGINETQTWANTVGNNSAQEQINHAFFPLYLK